MGTYILFQLDGTCDFFTAIVQSRLDQPYSLEYSCYRCHLVFFCLYTLYSGKYFMWPVFFPSLFLFLSHFCSSVIGCETKTLPSYLSNKVCLQSEDEAFLINVPFVFYGKQNRARLTWNSLSRAWISRQTIEPILIGVWQCLVSMWCCQIILPVS